jgi:hypothetical protein
LATFCFIFVTGRKIPLYYGSRFLTSQLISSIMAAEQFAYYSGSKNTVHVWFRNVWVRFNCRRSYHSTYR